ncbi:DUF6431 domain-containing protein [Faecalibaculum rodentium]|uniref:DUF6431 domain-containing protein n=1 Tax=Faecalibaculum rodentium TaxID=1702221 RepID=UPI003BEEE615
MSILQSIHYEINSSFKQRYKRSCDQFFADDTRKCPDCHEGRLHRHGSYPRGFNDPVNGVCDKVQIQRAKCSLCAKTHALIPTAVVPFSRVPLLAQLLIAVMTGLFKSPDHTPHQAGYELDRYALSPIVIRYISKGIKKYWSDFLSRSSGLLSLEELCLLAWKDRKKQLFQLSGHRISQVFHNPTQLF